MAKEVCLKIAMDRRILRAQILILIVGQQVKTTRIREALLIKADRRQHILPTKKQSIQVLIKMVQLGRIRVQIVAAKPTKISLASVPAKIHRPISGPALKRVPLIIETGLRWAPTRETLFIRCRVKSNLRVKFRLSCGR